MNILAICNKIIEYSFYALFFFVPLVLSNETSELFELNKMWLTIGLTIIITGAWVSKMILQKKILLSKTPLDIPIAIFLLSQIISSFFSLDFHVSLWGYYSRFNGGLISILCYILLYYAFVSNLLEDSLKKVKRMLFISLSSCVFVALWGFPSHFGFDPTCYLFRGSFDVSCWTASFQPKIRIFSTLGQPNWLSAFIAIFLPISIALFMQRFNPKEIFGKNKDLLVFVFAGISILFYMTIIFTGSRSGFFGLTAGLFVFFIFIKNKILFLKYIVLPIFIMSVILGTPFNQQLEQLTKKFSTQTVNKVSEKVTEPQSQSSGPALETGGTESGKIRLIVWQGAIEAWKKNPIFGSGVETFAFAYYKNRPSSHNLTSEWDYLYNKAHNEYLNYLTTTGIVGLGSYILMIFFFIFTTVKYLLKNRPSEQNKNSYIILALLSGYVSILVSNFLGFSVVIINIYLFLIPGFVFLFSGMILQRNIFLVLPKKISSALELLIIKSDRKSYLYISAVAIICLFLLFNLFKYWQADKNYSLGQSFDQAGQYQNAYIPLIDALEAWPEEPTFKDELAYNTAALSLLLTRQNDILDATESAQFASYSAKLAKDALILSNNIVEKHPNNIVFWKTRIRLLYLLSEIDPAYLALALDAASHAQKLAPTDAKISYSLGILYGQNNDPKKAIETLKNTIKLKPDYKDAYYALALFYHNQAIDKNNKVIDTEMQEKAIFTMQYILDNIAPNDAQAKKALQSWKN